MKTKVLKSSVISISILLFVAFVLGITGAIFRKKYQAGGNMLFNEGIYLQINGVKTEGNTAQFMKKGNEQPLGVVDAEEGLVINLETPQIEVETSTTIDFYIRARLETKFFKDGEPIEFEDGIAKTFATFFEFDENWKADSGYYYYSNDPLLAASKDNLKLVSKRTHQTINLFKNSEDLKIELNQDFGTLNGGPNGIDGFSVSLIIEVIDANHLEDTDWLYKV